MLLSLQELHHKYLAIRHYKKNAIAFRWWETKALYLNSNYVTFDVRQPSTEAEISLLSCKL